MSETTLYCQPKLLIAHHHRETRRAIQRYLCMNGYNTFDVENLAAANVLLKPNQFDGFICQVSLSDGSGMTAMQMAKRDLDIPTLALISAEEMDRLSQLNSVGAFDVWLGPPPFNLKRMLELLDDVLGIAVCPDCKGKGNILLLTSRVDCTRCNATGRFRAETPPF